MLTIREKFHKIGNWHNKVSVAAGVAKAILKHRVKDISSVTVTKDIINRLTEIEQHAIGSDKELNKLKDVIYEIIDPDTGKLREKQ